MEYIYNTKFTCASQIKVVVNDGFLEDVEFLGGGCNGNLKAICKLIKGKKIDEIVDKLEGITCGRRPTSCADQLTKALKIVNQ